MHFLDSHIHLQDYKTQEVKNVVNNAAKNNVSRFINVSAHPRDWESVRELAEQYPQIIPAYGVHPWHINEISENWASELENLLQKNQQSMVGECGIDRLRNPDVNRQIQILQTHIELANKYNRPLIIHAVKADSELTQLFSGLPKRSIFHSFTGSVEWGRQIQKHVFFIGINFSVLRKKNAAEILRGISLNRVLLETDGPYQNIIKGEETLPQNLPNLAQKIAELIGIDLGEFSDILNHKSHQNVAHDVSADDICNFCIQPVKGGVGDCGTYELCLSLSNDAAFHKICDVRRTLAEGN